MVANGHSRFHFSISFAIVLTGQKESNLFHLFASAPPFIYAMKPLWFVRVWPRINTAVKKLIFISTFLHCVLAVSSSSVETFPLHNFLFQVFCRTRSTISCFTFLFVVFFCPFQSCSFYCSSWWLCRRLETVLVFSCNFALWFQFSENY